LIFVFDDYALDTDRRELRRRNELVAIEPQIFDLLQFLIRNRERVVSKDDLIAAVWNGRIVSESTVTSRINAIRHAVGDSGEQQRLIRTIARKGHRFVGEVQEEQEPRRRSAAKSAPPTKQNETTSPAPPNRQTVTFCRTKDGVNLAVATVGEGPVLVRTAHWVTHIEYDWQSPITGPLLRRLAGCSRLVRYDGRGTGLSDRNVSEISFETFIDDLEAVVDSLQLERFSLLGIAAGAATAIAYAARR
jgi:DNA-binding winged helix-turn-helix (wHTH) protein